MFVLNLSIKNYKLFDSTNVFKLSDLNVPDSANNGSGLNVIVGENGCGKTTILEAIGTTLLEYKAESFDVTSMNNPNEETCCVHDRRGRRHGL